MLALHKLKVEALKALCDEREIDYSGCNKKQLIAMLKEAEKEEDAQIVEEGDDDGCYDGNESQAEDENAASERQSVTDSVAIARLKLQLELENNKSDEVRDGCEEMRGGSKEIRGGCEEGGDEIIDAKRTGDVIS